ncbi:MAG: RNA polymerase sigma factor [Bacteroidales bacterium]|nr:RNA polymerase sigma factor [Bacteroidales bacterium]MBK7175357.1 RNA polymerase sigma factor [Bacteroidales bacterium]
MNTEVHDIHHKLVKACQAGDRKAQYELYHSYAKSMYNICCRMMNQTDEASDMLQEAFIDAFSRIGTFRFESTFGAWLKRIVINKCINALQKRRLQFTDDEIPENFPDDTNENSIDEEQLKLSVERVKKAMNQLPENARIVFSLYLLEGYDHTEIAEILNITESTSKTQFMRARQRVKEILLVMPEGQ